MSHTNEHSPDEAHPHGEHHKPQGRKLHKDWRLWAMVILMLAAIAIYLLTLDLR
jgi:hypothetical protein